MDQVIISADPQYAAFDQFLQRVGARRTFLVCDGSLPFLPIADYLRSYSDQHDRALVSFSDFSPNPTYESVRKGVACFRKERCDLILAIGGGSAMDVAKCVKLYAEMDDTRNYLTQPIVPNSIPLICAPTTAGTGSEATQFAVIYYNGEKQSISHPSCIPSAVLFDPDFLKTLPEYQKKSTMLDAFCHAVESLCSVRSTAESNRFALRALQILIKNAEDYLGRNTCRSEMLTAANLAGKAINISQTTAGHAMAYKLTSLYGIAHGHAAALCVAELLPFMADHMDLCVDPRGKEHLQGVFEQLAAVFGRSDIESMCEAVRQFILQTGLSRPTITDDTQLGLLCSSVNPVRLKNNPVPLDPQTIRAIYQRILTEQVN